MRKSLVKGVVCDQLELDEMWSFVGKKKEKRWLWVILCRQTRQIVAYCIGDRSNKTFKRLYRKLPPDYQACYSFSDLWAAYKMIDSNKHSMGGKETGNASRLERWNNTIRQRLARYVRKTLSFSKKDKFHHLITKIFIWFYNMELKEQLVWRIAPSTH
jgi:IS1 family transposase